MAAFGIFFNQGEVCSANSRLYVEASIRDRFLEKLVERAQAMQPGDPLDPASKMGAIVDERQTQGIMRFVEAGKRSSPGHRRRAGQRGRQGLFRAADDLCRCHL